MKKLFKLIAASILTASISALAAVTVSVNGTNYSIPQNNEKGWGTAVTSWIQAISSNTLQPNTGTFTLTADLDFGGSYGLKSQYYKSRSSNISTTGVLRLSNSDGIGWRDSGNTANYQLLPSATDGLLQYNSINLVNASSSQTLTNKTIDADANTITNIENADIKSGAAITRSKLADGTASHVLINDGSGVMSSEASLAISRGGTGQASQTAAFDALAPTTTAGDVIVHNGTDNVRLPVGTDGQTIVADSSQTNKLKWTALPQGAKNYLTYNNFENNATTGFALGNVSIDSTTKFPTGSPTFGSGASGNLSIATSASSPLAGTYSLTYVSSAATTAGNFLASDAYTIDAEDKAKPLAVSFSYEISSGASNGVFGGTSSDSFGIALYDTANSAWIMPAGVRSMYQSSGAGKAYATFQTASNTTSLRVVFFNANATSDAITVKLDSFVLGPEKTVQGVPASDLEPFTPTGSWSTNSTYTGFKSRKGDQVRFIMQVATSGAPTAASLTFNLPSGMSIDATKLVSNMSDSNGALLGNASIYDATGDNYRGYVIYNSATSVLVKSISPNGGSPNLLGNSSVSSTAPFTFASGDRVVVDFTVPIIGLSSNVAMSSDSDTRSLALKAGLTSNQSIPTGTLTTVVLNTASKDTHSILNTSTGVITIPIAGRYTFSGYFVYAASGTGYRELDYRIDGTGANTTVVLQNGDGTNGNYIPFSFDLDLNAGQTVEIRTFQNSGGNLNFLTSSKIDVKRLSGPAVVAASESVVAYAVNKTPTGTISGSYSGVKFGAMDKDSHGMYSDSTNLFTAPQSGVYELDAMVEIQNSSVSAGNEFYLTIFTGSGATALGGDWKAATGSSPTRVMLHATKSRRLLAGQNMSVSIISQGSSPTYAAVIGGSSVTFKRIGNY